MRYSEFVKIYDKLERTSRRLEKVEILAGFLKKLKEKGKPEWIYLIRGRVFPEYDSREFGISDKLVVRVIARTSGAKEEEILKRYRKVGDLGGLSEEFLGNKKQSTLFSSKLDVERVFNNLRKMAVIEGKGTIDKKLGLISELLNSASGGEAKYIVRTLLGDLRIGVAGGVLRDALALAFFEGDKEMVSRIEEAYDLANDYAVIFEEAGKGKKELEKIAIKPGRPVKVMLPIKVENIKEAFRICGKPAALEHKYDGFRVMINKDSEGRVSLFTRRLENVTRQFPDIVEVVKKHVKGKSFILDSEVVGYDPKTKEYKPFEAVSQRIKRKYDIPRLTRELPVEINVFDVLFFEGKILGSGPFKKRREFLEKIVKKVEKKIRPSFQLVTDSEFKAMKFYEKALGMGEEGIMVKKLDAPYKAGRRVGYMVKMKPETKDLDLVIIGAEYGSGKRGGWLTSYILGCKGNNGDFLEVGKVSSGLKEKSEEGTTYDEMTEILKKLIISEKGKEVKVRPEVVVSVTYQNIQPSPSYDSGYALRFPRITSYRPDRKTDDIATLEDVRKEAKKER